EKLKKYAQERGGLVGFPEAENITNRDLLELPCEVLVPAATDSQITEENAGRVKARLIVEGANGPLTPEADAILDEREITVVPDILANAGGVVVSYFEWVQDLQYFFWSVEEVNHSLERIMKASLAQVLSIAHREKVNLRTAALMLAVQRIKDAIDARGIYP
ncbi:MAG: glutamate dehydrogenase, partial [Chloroflexota bacterium]|nr:glutamate dehydrogenase [Chloroflexota bacterium]